MSYYKPCPDCGANLDQNESCDCKSLDCRQKKNGLPDANQISPRKGKIPSPKHNIAQSAVVVKTLSVPVRENPMRENALRDLRVTKNIPVKEMVAVVRVKHPKYDKHLHSKCEHGEDYGIQLCEDAMNDLRVVYASEQLAMPEVKNPSGPDRHLLKNRVSCRLPDDLYEKFIKYTREDGYNTQDWLAETVGKYVRRKDFAVLYNREKAREAQRRYCEANGVPFFIRYVVLCPRCDRDIMYPVEHPDGTVTGITIEGAGKGHITYCPHCRASFID